MNFDKFLLIIKFTKRLILLKFVRIIILFQQLANMKLSKYREKEKVLFSVTNSSKS